jgi:hypothetical protein
VFVKDEAAYDVSSPTTLCPLNSTCRRVAMKIMDRSNSQRCVLPIATASAASVIAYC